MKFYVCKTCGNIVEMVCDAGTPIVCCGKNMSELMPGITDGDVEKHIPVYEVKDNIVTVNVGTVDHPMLDEHSIKWIIIRTKRGEQKKMLKPGDKPCAKFILTEDDSLLAVYAYCDIHGLWKSK